MKKLLLAMTLTLLVGVAAYAVPIDISNSTVTITGPTTFTMNGIAAMGSTYWCDFIWDETHFDFTDYGEETGSCPSVVGEWTLNYYWGDGTTSITFYSDGTFYSGGGYWGTWIQDDCDVEWFYDSGTHYWGVMDTGGNYMDGEMLSYSGSPGTWDATRN